jgi:hypothetical protein
MKYLRIVSCIIVGLLGLVSTSKADISYQWHYLLTQDGRNAKIVERAKRDVGVVVGRQCKEWVYDVVKSASWQVVLLPLNNPNDPIPYFWVYGKDVVGSGSMALDLLKPGYIIQMRYPDKNDPTKYHPHTVVVTGVDVIGKKFNVIHCNFAGDGKVTTYSWTFADFYAKTKLYYTVYWIL